MSTACVSLKVERYSPRIYGFRVNEVAKLQRWQEAVRDRYGFYLLTKDISRLNFFLVQSNCPAGSSGREKCTDGFPFFVTLIVV